MNQSRSVSDPVLPLDRRSPSQVTLQQVLHPCRLLLSTEMSCMSSTWSTSWTSSVLVPKWWVILMRTWGSGRAGQPEDGRQVPFPHITHDQKVFSLMPNVGFTSVFILSKEKEGKTGTETQSLHHVSSFCGHERNNYFCFFFFRKKKSAPRIMSSVPVFLQEHFLMNWRIWPRGSTPSSGAAETELSVSCLLSWSSTAKFWSLETTEDRYECFILSGVIFILFSFTLQVLFQSCLVSLFNFLPSEG